MRSIRSFVSRVAFVRPLWMPFRVASDCSLRGVTIQHRVQLLRADGLGEIAIHVGGEAAFPVALHDEGGHGDDRLVAAGAGLRARGCESWRVMPSISGICTSISTRSNVALERRRWLPVRCRRR